MLYLFASWDDALLFNAETAVPPVEEVSPPVTSPIILDPEVSLGTRCYPIIKLFFDP